MTVYDLHAQKVNLTMVSAHYALKALYKEFGPDLIKQTIDSFETRDNAAITEPPADKRLVYVKGKEFALR